ncbi:achacin-like [Liolophura sinensis]|uniref:achacin-like n=1 Tax=Liolophura sinensis TaxID=3198878 RepID=UPI0031594FAD
MAARKFLVFLLTATADCSILFGNRESTEECLDVAIVGGGIGGTYTGWRLKDQGLKIAIFESTDRIGGRMHSVFLPSIPNVPAELGAMRYVEGVHTTLEGLLPKLGLQSKEFALDRHSKLFYTRGRRMGVMEFLSDNSPFLLAPTENRNPLILAWNASQQLLNTSEPDKIPDIEDAVTVDGVPLYQLGYLNALNKVWTNEAKEYIKTFVPFESLFGSNINAVHRTVVRNPGLPPQHTRTVVGGLQQVPRKLADQFLSASNRHKIRLNRRINTIRKVWLNDRFVYQMTLFETETLDGHTADKWVNPHTICANQVILALPPQALQNIQWYPLQQYPHMQTAFKAVTEHSAMKLFLVYPNAWWSHLNISSSAFNTDLPLRQGGEFGRFRNSSGHEAALFMASYADGENNNNYWQTLRNIAGTISSSAVPKAHAVSTRVAEQVQRHLADVYGIKPDDIPQPLDGVMHIWNDEQTGGAWQSLKPGYKPKVVSKSVRQPSPSDRVFIITNAFSRKLSMWSEGSLEAVNDVLAEFFNLK